MEEIINPSHDVGQSIPIPALAVCLTLCDDHIKAKKSGHDDSSCTQGGEMVKAVRRRITHEPTADTLAELQHVLLSLQDDLSETMAWTALLCDGLCGILAEHGTEIDSTTHTGVRFAVIWLKQRNEIHAASLKAVCRKLREIRGQ